MKPYPERVDLADVWEYFEGFPMAHLATTEGNQPRVRMMALIAHRNSLWMVTKAEWDKVRQIRINQNVEITVPALIDQHVGCIRITGVADEIADRDTRADVAKAVPWFDQYWTGPHDSNYVLLRIHPSRMLFDHPTDRKKYTIQL